MLVTSIRDHEQDFDLNKISLNIVISREMLTQRVIMKMTENDDGMDIPKDVTFQL